jgi:ABC-type glycerol-3-phosphate transport system permease component
LKKIFYVWHRYLGIVTCAVVLLWSVSGFLHPLMSWLQPRPKLMRIASPALKVDDFGATPQEAFARHDLTRYQDFQVIRLEGRPYYQVRTEPDRPLRYFSTRDGAELLEGDRQYAVWLARQYLQDFQSPVTEVQLVTDFDREYKVINKLLPVYRVQFDRPDQMRAYVETTSGLLGTLVDRTKGRLMALFVALHNWDWVVGAGGGNWLRISLLVTFTSLVALMAISGILVYGFFWKTFRPLTTKTDQPRNRLKRYHRRLGLTVSVTMIFWASSAAYHAVEKPGILAEAKAVYAPQEFQLTDTPFPLSQILLDPALGPIVNLSMVRLGGKPAYQVFLANRQVQYHDATTGERIEGAHDRYLRELASTFSGLDPSRITSIRPVTKFDDEYGFLNKRLPVVRVEYQDDNQTRYFLEPVGGQLWLTLGNWKRLESYTFNYLHKWNFLNWAGRMTRDVTMMLFVTLQAVLSGSGLILFLMWKRATVGPSVSSHRRSLRELGRL